MDILSILWPCCIKTFVNLDFHTGSDHDTTIFWKLESDQTLFWEQEPIPTLFWKLNLDPQTCLEKWIRPYFKNKIRIRYPWTLGHCRQNVSVSGTESVGTILHNTVLKTLLIYTKSVLASDLKIVDTTFFSIQCLSNTTHWCNKIRRYRIDSWFNLM